MGGWRGRTRDQAAGGGARGIKRVALVHLKLGGSDTGALMSLPTWVVGFGDGFGPLEVATDVRVTTEFLC